MTSHDGQYHSNPFRTMVRQLTMLLNANPISSLLFGLVMLAALVAGFLGLMIIVNVFNNNLGFVLATVLGITYFVVVVFRFAAASNVLNFASREGRELTVQGALKEAVSKNYGNFVLTSLASAVLILIGFVLVLLPGFYLMGRLSMAPLIALKEGLGVTDSLKRSWALSNGHWAEVFASNFVSAFVVPEGLLSVVGGQTGLIGRYYELTELEKSGSKAPDTHWMNYLVVAVVAVVLIGYVAYIRMIGNALNTDSNNICDDSAYSLLCENSSDSLNSKSSNDYKSLFDNYDYQPSPSN